MQPGAKPGAPNSGSAAPSRNGGANGSAALFPEPQLDPGRSRTAAIAAPAAGSAAPFLEQRRNWQRGAFQNGGANGSVAPCLSRPVRPGGARVGQLPRGSRAPPRSAPAGPGGAHWTAPGPARPDPTLCVGRLPHWRALCIPPTFPVGTLEGKVASMLEPCSRVAAVGGWDSHWRV
jgi:hypothetical protein